MSQSTGTGTDFFSPLIIFGTDVLVLVLVLVQFSSTDSVLVLITQVLSQSVPAPTRQKQPKSCKKICDYEDFQNIWDFSFEILIYNTKIENFSSTL